MSKRAVLLLQKNTWWMLLRRGFKIWKLWPLRIFGLIVLAAHKAHGELFFIEFLQAPPTSRSNLYCHLRLKLIERVARHHTWHTAARVSHVLNIIKKYNRP